MKNSIGKITAVICCAALAAVSCLFPAAVYVPAQAAVLSRSQITVAIDPGHQKKQDLGMLMKYLDITRKFELSL